MISHYTLQTYKQEERKNTMFDLITSIERTSYVATHVIPVYCLFCVISNKGNDKL